MYFRSDITIMYWCLSIINQLKNKILHAIIMTMTIGTIFIMFLLIIIKIHNSHHIYGVAGKELFINITTMKINLITYSCLSWVIFRDLLNTINISANVNIIDLTKPWIKQNMKLSLILILLFIAKLIPKKDIWVTLVCAIIILISVNHSMLRLEIITPT